jgi:aerobic-type carbon monoxide dehydrogenase small subunit (CoxS/CutS family)
MGSPLQRMTPQRRLNQMIETIKFTLNRKPLQMKVDGERRLLWVLRSDLGLTGTKYGCGEGICGACTVLINKKASRACQVPVREIQGKEIITIEGLSEGGRLHPIQKAFIEHNALQCGFCTPGMILNAYSLLLEKPSPTEAEIIRGMNDNLCRCGAHVRIIQAIQTAGQEMRGGRKR